jgi:hypothetical protein
MPFTMTMCSRSMGEAKEEQVGSENVAQKSSTTNYFSYLLYPTEYSVSGFGFTYGFLKDASRGRFKFDLFQLIPLAFICSVFSLLFTYRHKRKLSFYLSLLNATSLLSVAIFVFVDSLLSNSLDELFEFMLWGFWLAIILSVIDVYLAKRNACS